MTSAHQSADLVNNITKWEEDGKQALALNTRAVNIIWGGEGSKGRYWQRTTAFDSEDKDISFEVLELIGVCWLELTGKIPLNLLTPGTTYTFFVTLKLTQKASGWRNTPVIFRLHLPGNTEKAAAVDLSQYADGEWVDVPDGGLDFAVPQDNSSGVLSLAMYEFEGEEWKRGLIIKDVKFYHKKILGQSSRLKILLEHVLMISEEKIVDWKMLKIWEISPNTIKLYI